MLNWNQIYRYLNFEISYEDAGFDNAIKNWKIDDGTLIPHHDMLLLGELINGLNKILAGEIPFAVFKKLYDKKGEFKKWWMKNLLHFGFYTFIY